MSANHPDDARSERSSRNESRRSSTKSRRSSGCRLSPIRQPSGSPRSPRHNKIYRCPPTPPPEELYVKEKSFILDSMATASISQDYSKANPKLGPVIPPYNAQRDRHTTNYFTFLGVDRTLKRTGQYGKMATSIEGPVMDYFHTEGKGYQYLALRNEIGAGHSRETIDGHAQFMQGVKPVIGYNGPYGFRRNTPWLRQMPSPFGTSTLSCTHEDKEHIVC